MTISAYRVDIKDQDLGTSSVKYFSSLYDATVFFGQYKNRELERLVLSEISSKTVLASR